MIKLSLSDLFPQTSEALEWRRDLRQLNQHNWPVAMPVQQAAQALEYLNRCARLGYHKPQVYALKTPVLGYFGFIGYEPKVSLKLQELECYACRGTGIYLNTWSCRKCGGTGVYASHYLLELVYDINGLTYTWHQPVERATDLGLLFSVPDKADATKFENFPPVPVATHENTIRWNMAKLVVFLSSPYGQRPPLFDRASAEHLAGHWKPLRQTLVSDLRFIVASVRSRIWYGRRWVIQFCPDCHRPSIWLGETTGKHSQCDDMIPF